MDPTTISATETAARLGDGAEMALIDVREVMPFATGHPFVATNLPLARLELDVAALVPRADTRVSVIDGGEGSAEVAARRLAGLGYTDVSIVDGGTPGWAAAGKTLFPEIEVVAKGFGDFVARRGRPRFIEADDLARAIDGAAGGEWVVLDSRPRTEYHAGNIPGSIDAPAGQVLRCFDDLVSSPDTKVVINCMSRTRGILGGTSLVAAGVPNEVHVLWNGTRGWQLAGHALEVGATRHAAPPTDGARARARARAAALAARAGLRTINLETLGQWRADRSRTTYVFDVRDREEYEAGHLRGARSAPEGSLVMSADRYFATQNARCVLVDDDTVRATVAALWLAQIGRLEVTMLEGGFDAGTAGPDAIEIGPEPGPVVGLGQAAPDTLGPQELAARLGGDPDEVPLVVDVGGSAAYAGAHLPGARWCLRSALPGLISELPRNRGRPGLVLTSQDGAVARLAAHDLGEEDVAAEQRPDLAVLEGGNDAWRAAGLPIASGAEHLLCAPDDHFLASSERPGDVTANVIAYLDWESGLLEDIERGGFVPYRNRLWA